MFNFTKTSLNDLFAEGSFPDYSIIITAIKNRQGETPSEAEINEILTACSNLMSASYINHYCEKSGTLIVCFLNYDSAVFSIRAFVGSLRQTMYTISRKNRSYVCYSEGLQDRRKVSEETVFLMEAVKYGYILGSAIPYTGSLLHRLNDSRTTFPFNLPSLLYDDLVEKKYDRVIDYLSRQEQNFTNLFDNGDAYDYNGIIAYVAEMLTVFKLFFTKQNYEFSFAKKNIFDLLFDVNGCAGLMRLFADSVTKYRDNFMRIPASEREQRNMREILNHISENLSTVSLSETAAHFDLTDAYLCRLFKKNMGMNFTEYLKEKRLETALRLLQGDEKMTVSAISQAIGMKSQSHFQNVFKNEFGITPENYRRNYRLNKPE